MNNPSKKVDFKLLHNQLTNTKVYDYNLLFEAYWRRPSIKLKLCFRNRYFYFLCKEPMAYRDFKTKGYQRIIIQYK